MPNWTPGKQRGKPVNSRFTLPISFKLPLKKENLSSNITSSKIQTQNSSNNTIQINNADTLLWVNSTKGPAIYKNNGVNIEQKYIKVRVFGL